VSPTDFSWEPLFLGLAAIVAAVYTYISRRQPPSHGRIVLFAAGLLLIAASLNSPLETIAAHYLLLVHLLQNALIADLAPPLVILGLTPAMRAAVTRAGGRPLDALTRPQVALPLWLLAWYGTHAAGFYDWALRSGWALNLEHAILIAAGFLFWWPLLSGRLSTPVALAYLAVAFVGSSFLGLALIFSTTPFYDYYKHTPRLWGLSPSRDQNLGGILMNAEQTLVFLTAIAYYLWRLLEEEHASGADGSRAAG
jgi:cytochrome c oxidase assembly factor CtaG